ncbi:twin-arginine translocase TatA/TatE family subunit [Actomonas aquatica]|uniref:Sec-independent protein translocase protein TatA n=1 Tax=Actomonas aquatica TaxID=2866162 RepID=A0ABZ1C7G1_9BACT|nr:twin-arginine translocase TatA/TatE family subunit [Opitutus sp. WL0086]WRQ87406.1 twin-arginine translocase TatA/TatE family subunit [Opitutus sp. WL0086]
MNDSTMLAMPLGGPEMLIILGIVILLFGAKKLPELARGLGKAKSEFQKASQEAENELKSVQDEPKKSAENPRQTTTPPGNN